MFIKRSVKHMCKYMDLEYVIWCLKWGSIPKNDKYGITFVLGLATQNTIGPTHQCGCMNQFEPYPFDQSHGKTVFACHHDHHHQHQHPYQQHKSNIIFNVVIKIITIIIITIITSMKILLKWMIWGYPHDLGNHVGVPPSSTYINVLYRPPSF